MIRSAALAAACVRAATAIACPRPPIASTDAHAARRPMPPAVSTAARPANTAVSRTIRMKSTFGSVAPRWPSSQTPTARAGASITDPVSNPLKNPQRGGAVGSRVLTRGWVESGIANGEGQPPDYRSMFVGLSFLRLTLESKGFNDMPASSNPNRSYAAAHFALELDGKDAVGLFRSIEGGGVRADVMTYQMGPNYDRWRQLGKPKFEDIKLQVGMAMSGPFYTWIAQFFAGQPDRKNGAIIAADFFYKERAPRVHERDDQRAHVPETRRLRQERRVHGHR